MHTRLLIIAALAACTVWGAAPTLHVSALGPVPGAVQPDAQQTLHTLEIGAGTLAPLDAMGNPEWPCFTGHAADYPDCSSIPSGGLVIGDPMYTLSLSDCTESSSIPCVWLFYIVEDDNPSTTGEMKYFVKVTQQGSVLFDTGTVLVGPNVEGVYVVAGNAAFGPGNCPSTETCVAPVKGAAKISVTFKVGTASVTSDATVVFN
ncbi:MAG: hypothetical protein ACLP59_23475 [Bryobacteraceae bacterium]